MLTKELIESEIADFVLESDKKGRLTDKWRRPLVGFASADHPDFTKLKELIPGHQMPRDVIPGARTVIAYFVPFTEKIPRGNEGGGLASPDWALCYEETNDMFRTLNESLISFLRRNGAQAAVSGEAAVFDREHITSRWSQRHIARIAGLGTFGLNNMLITEAGCCGRIQTVVTNLIAAPDRPLETENCLYKRNGSCGLCVKRCETGALTAAAFDRKACFARCLENARVYTQFGNSYASKAGEALASTGSEVCGKCLTALPCSFNKP